MASTGSVQVTANITDVGFGNRIWNAIGQVFAGINDTQSIILQNGFNVIGSPAGGFAVGASYCLIVFPPSSTTTKTLKGVTGDTGIILGTNGFVLLSVNGTVTTGTAFGITTNGNDTLPTTISWL